MVVCCFCRFPIQIGQNIFTDSVSETQSVLYKDVINQIIESTEYELTTFEKEICTNCSEKVIDFHKATEVLKRIRREFLDMLKYSPANDAEEQKTHEDLCDEIQFLEQQEYTCGNYNQTGNSFETEHVVIDMLESENEITFDIKREDLISDDELLPEENIIEKDDDDEVYVLAYNETLQETDNKFINNSINSLKRVRKIKEVSCAQCDSTFFSQRQLQIHYKKQHFSGHVCEICGKTLHSSSGLYAHLKNHKPANDCECTVCGKSFNTKDKLKHHMAWHSGEQPFQCEICAKRFVHRNGLQRHRLIHDQETRRKKCDKCGFKFRLKSHLDRHMMTHTGAKPFSCPICGKCFALMYNLKVHVREHEEPGSTRQQRYKCKNCPRTFTNKRNFEQHCEKNDCDKECVEEIGN